MIFCLAQKPELYDVIFSGGTIGLWSSYGHDPNLFNLISRTHMAMFSYEPGVAEACPPGERIYVINNIENLQKTLTQSVGNIPVVELLQLDPAEMLQVFQTNTIDHLALVTDSIDKDAILLIMLLRTLQWRRHYRGAVKNGKVTKVQFKSTLTEEEEMFLDLWLNAARQQLVQK